MEDQQKPTKKIALNYGVYLGFASVLLSVILFATGQHLERNLLTNLLGIAIIAVFIILGIKQYKQSNNGFLTLGQGLKTGIGIALIGALISVVYTVIFAKFIEPTFIDQVVEMQRQQLLDNPSMTDEMIERMEKGTRDYFYIATTGMILIVNLFLGFVISLIASLAMQKKENEY